jgi:hypothetical protein
MDALSLAESAPRDWRETESGRRYELHLPYWPSGYYSYAMDWRSARGLELLVAGGKVVQVSVALYEDSSTLDTLRERWGRPRKTTDEWTWRKPDRIVTADLDSDQITIRKRGVIIPE